MKRAFNRLSDGITNLKKVKFHHVKGFPRSLHIYECVETIKCLASTWYDIANLLYSPFTHCVHVYTHSRDLATAMLVKFVATRLTSEAIKKKLVAKVTVSQLEESFPYLDIERGHKNIAQQNQNQEYLRQYLRGSYYVNVWHFREINNVHRLHVFYNTYKIVHCERNIIQDLD